MFVLFFVILFVVFMFDLLELNEILEVFMAVVERFK